MTHDLKILTEWFNAVISGIKTFEIRKDDRNFQPRDELLLREWDGTAYTGRTCMADVTMVLRGEYCREGYCTMAIRVRGLSALERGRWIPCSERLPEQDTMVIVCYYGSDCIFPMQGETVTEAVARQNKVPTVTMGFLDEEGWCGADMFPMMVQPTFWMNLPDAPEVIP